MIAILQDLNDEQREWVIGRLKQGAKPLLIHSYSELKSIAEYLRCHSEGWSDEYHNRVLSDSLTDEEIHLLGEISKRPDDKSLAEYCQRANRAIRKRVVRMLQPKNNNKKWWQL